MKILLLTCFIIISSFSFGQAPKGELPFGANNERVLRFYPNPAASFINFEFKAEEKGYTLQIYSLVGKKMLEVPVVSLKTSVPLTDFFRGIYIFQLRDKSGRMLQSGKFQVAK